MITDMGSPVPLAHRLTIRPSPLSQTLTLTFLENGGKTDSEIPLPNDDRIA
jgi:hypothetical protein